MSPHKTFPKPAPKPPARRRRMAARSERGQGYQDEYNAMKPLIHARSGECCEARLDGCTVRATDEPHHRKRRGQGGPNTMANLLDVCQSCHNTIHRGGNWSYDNGLLIRRADPITTYLGGIR